MPSWLFSLFCLPSHGLSARDNTKIRFLKAQIRVLRAHVPGQRIIPTPAERALLLSIGAELDHQIDNLITLVQARTCHRWVRERITGRPVGRVGRPREITGEIREAIVRFAMEKAPVGLPSDRR